MPVKKNVVAESVVNANIIETSAAAELPLAARPRVAINTNQRCPQATELVGQASCQAYALKLAELAASNFENNIFSRQALTARVKHSAIPKNSKVLSRNQGNQCLPRTS